MDIPDKVLNFDEALSIGGFHDKSRAILAVSWDDAMELWKFMRRHEEEEYVRQRFFRTRLVRDNHLKNGLPIMELEEVPPPPKLPLPEPGKIWGFVYGIRIYVEGPGDEDQN